jgi:large subunit ribosomal protein L2
MEYDPNRSSFIALVFFKNGLYTYLIAPQGLKIGDTLYTFKHMPEILTIGSNSCIKYLPAGSTLYNLECFPGAGNKLVRSAGTFCLLLKKDLDSNIASVKLPSGVIRNISVYCNAYVGSVSNKDYKFINLGKAGRTRWLGVRPSVRGVAMNPVDHPHGGGEGRKSGRVCPMSPWGKLNKGQKTSRKK